MIEQKINIAELLKDCPSGMELNCVMSENVYFDEVLSNSIKCYYIKNSTKIRSTVYFNKFGEYFGIDNAKCVIFPKGKTTWEGFHRPFKDGDIIFTGADSTRIGLGNTWISIFKENRNGGVDNYVDYCNEDKDFYTYLDDKCLLCLNEDIIQQRLATEGEKQRLFDVIKAKGYMWNPESKTLEKLEKEYPKTYDECCDMLNADEFVGYELMTNFPKLINARNAYWKIAGEEMGLSKPWEPDWQGEGCYVIVNHRGNIVTDVQWHANAILAFPTEEMRDAFKNNFDPDIEICKEFL